MDRVRWGIIGCGDVCEIKSGPAFYQIPHSELVAVMRRDAEKAEDFARRHRVKKWYTDAEELIADEEVDIVYVATPPNTHKEYAIRVMRAGKPVYVEKPVTMNEEEYLELLQVAEETGQRFIPAFYRRGLPYFRKIKELLEAEVIGTLLTVNVRHYRSPLDVDFYPSSQTWRLDRTTAGEGYFFDLAPHTLDILDYLLGQISDAQAFSSNRGNLYEVKDTLSIALRFESGLTGSMQYCFVSPQVAEEESVRIQGTKGELRFSVFSLTPIRVTTDTSDPLVYDFSRPLHIQQPLIEMIVDELRGTGVCPSTMESGARTARVLDLILR